MTREDCWEQSSYNISAWRPMKTVTGEFTCCRSSLSDLSWATMALMQPFMEHSVA